MIALLFLVQTFRIAIPYLLAAAGGVMSERVGVIALYLEGLLLAGAFGAAMGAHYSGSAWVGLIGAVLLGQLLMALLAVAVLRFRADQVIAGIAINLLAVGVTRFFLQLLTGSASNSPRVAGFGSTRIFGSAVISPGDPVVWIGVLSLPFLLWLLYRTPFGLRARVTGESPEVAISLGIRAKTIRMQGLMIAALLTSLGGAYLALDQHQFTDGMSAGRGFIALAAVIFGRWQPVRVALVCVFFAAAEALQIQLQGTQLMPSQFIESIPYVLTILALAGAAGKYKPPASLGKSM